MAVGYPNDCRLPIRPDRAAVAFDEGTMKRCLIVDDSSVIRKVARRILERLEFEIAEAEDGEQALQLCRDRMPDVVLLDWNMPRMDGYEFLRLLRRRREAAEGRVLHP
jgi:CheY-like chemotaxis protein